ncbi:factor-independent urate hydroxylase [Nocardia camponoti]|uniref:Uricase n=1 Tax=Nocardia camponoti TaxID=1616106 RepID=A0A917QHT2_9NOCA|nr:urate oxidase [Nocardia camponoti]GGK51232.1 uricase [Nocardia camponoti]
MPLSGAIELTDNRYGKAENRVVRFFKQDARHEIRDVNVTTTLRGDFAEAYTEGDQRHVLPTDTQKHMTFVYAQRGIETIEGYALGLAAHFVDSVEPVTSARIDVEAYAWQRISIDGVEHDHSWSRLGPEVRTAAVTVSGDGTWVVGGIKDLVVLKSTGSEFNGFLVDEFTTLPPTDDRVLATSLVVNWRFADTTGFDWDEVFAGIRATLLELFATTYSKALQQTLYAMGTAVLERFPMLAEIRLSAPNKHHFDYNLGQFGIENKGEVFWAADRPYGSIHATLTRSDAPEAGPAWEA